jgi:transcriptional regulator with XRE-family HTH domain
MPRRRTPDPLALAIGQRIRQLREQRGLTAERLAFESELGSKGFLSDIEHGLALPSLHTLEAIAAHLAVDLLDLVTIPEASERQALVDRTRLLSRGVVRRLLREMPAAVASDAPTLARVRRGRTGVLRVAEPTAPAASRRARKT